MMGTRKRALDDLPIAVVGCDFRRASTSWRNALLLGDGERRLIGEQFRTSADVSGLVLLQTCNRVEWILSGPKPRWAAQLARAQLLTAWQKADLPRPHPRPYLHHGRAAVAHLVRVALGLESFVRGEREIAGQLNRAFGAARADGLASPEINALQTTLGRVVKRVGRLTTFGARTRGVAGLAVDFAREQIALGATADGSRKARLCVVGMGEIGRKCAALAEQVYGLDVIRVNRTIPAKQRSHWRPIGELATVLRGCDAVIVATGASGPIVTEVTVARAQAHLPIIDIGTPDQVQSTPKIRRIGLDDLLVGVDPAPDDFAAVLALAEDAVTEYSMALRKREVAGLLRATQDHYDQFVHAELPALLATSLHTPDQRLGLQSELRDAVRAYTRQIVAEIERAVGGN